MHKIIRNLFLLVLMFLSALMTVPGIGRACANGQIHEAEAPTQVVDKLEFIRAEVARQGRYSNIERTKWTWKDRSKFELLVRSRCRLSVSANHARMCPSLRGHRLHNGLLAPLRI